MTDPMLHDKNQAEIGRLLAEQASLHANAANLNKKTRWYEVVMIGGFVVALLAAGKYLL